MSNADETRAIIETSEGSMTIELFPEKAPKHVENFVKLAEEGFYDGTVFHRVIAGFIFLVPLLPSAAGAARALRILRPPHL